MTIVATRSDSTEYAPHPGAVAAARLRTRLNLRGWGLKELADEAEQIVSELISNSIEAHQREQLDAPVRLTLLAGLRTALIVVRDASRDEPVRKDPGVDLESGRGLLIVDALADHWCWKPVPDGGKAVRVLLRGKPIDSKENPCRTNSAAMTASTWTNCA